MSQVLRSEFYTFAPATKQITFAGVPALTLDRILGIYNLTRSGAQIYDPFDSTVNGTLSGNTLTLVYDTTGHAAGDSLMVLTSNEALDGLQRTYSITATGSTVGIPTAGYGSFLVELVGTFNATVTVEGSSNTTDGSNGTFPAALVGHLPEDQSASGPSATLNSAIRRRLYRAVDAPWIRLSTTYTSGTVVAIVTRRVAPIGERVASVGGSVAALLLSTTASIGSLGAVGVSTGGLSLVSRIVSSAASTNTTLAKSSGGRLYKVTGLNAGSTVRWLRFFNRTTAPTPGTDTPFFAVALPVGPFSFDVADIGTYFSAGIAYAITANPADNDNTAIAAGDILNLNVWYA